MCTVTFLPTLNNNFILTSNRDEQRLRETDPPKKYLEDGVELLFPKDKLAGGTWIGTSDKNRLVCVLNGAFEKHKRKSHYKMSRGVIAKELLKSDNFLNYIDTIDLNEIEPFTMVIVDWNDNELCLCEFVWDEKEKHLKRLENKPKIWSSTTLYSDEVKKVREIWFQKWLGMNEINSEEILNFHHSKNGDIKQSIFMKRSYVETVSITSVKKEKGIIYMSYEDVIHSKNTLKSF